MVKVYIASPYTKGDQAANVKLQMDVANQLINIGYAPYAPLMGHFMQMVHPQQYERWMKLDFEWIRTCDCLLRLDGESEGADREVKEAQGIGKRIFYSVRALNEYYLPL